MQRAESERYVRFVCPYAGLYEVYSMVYGGCGGGSMV